MTPHGTNNSYDPQGLWELLRLLAIFAVVFSIAQFMGYSTLYGVDSISVIWPPAGVLGAALALCRRRHWVWLILISVTIDMLWSTARGWDLSDPHEQAFLWLKLTVNPLTGMLFALTLHYLIEDSAPLRGPRALGVYVFVAIGLNVAVVTLIGWVVVGLFVNDFPVLASWKQWAYSDITGMLAFATPLIVIAHRPDMTTQLRQRGVEGMVLVLVFAGTAYALFGLDRGEKTWAQHYQLIVLLPIFAWVVARFGPVMMTVVMSILVQAVLLGMAGQRGPFDVPWRSNAENVLMAQGVLVPGALALLFISSMLESRRRHYEREMDTQRRLRRLDRIETLGTMAGGVAHDFGNMAIAIRAYQSTLQSMVENPSEPVRNAIAGLGQIADGTQTLTRALMTFARDDESDRAEHGGRARGADLCLTVHTCLSAMRPLIGRRHRLEVSIPDESLVVASRAGDLQRVLSNLVINASDASAKGSMIRVTVSREGDQAVLRVSDEGVGMGPEVLSRVLDPFYTTKPRGKGTGLGLSVVSGVVREMGGTIDIDSALGKGTTITVRAPIVKGRVEMIDETEEPN